MQEEGGQALAMNVGHNEFIPGPTLTQPYIRRRRYESSKQVVIESHLSCGHEEAMLSLASKRYISRFLASQQRRAVSANEEKETTSPHDEIVAEARPGLACLDPG